MAAVKRAMPLLGAPGTITHYDSQASVNSGVAETRSVILLRVLGSNKANSQALYLMVFDSPTVPNNGATPAFQPLQLDVNVIDQREMSFNDIPGRGMYGLPLANGLSYAASTTSDTLTADTTNSVWVSLIYA